MQRSHRAVRLLAVLIAGIALLVLPGTPSSASIPPSDGLTHGPALIQNVFSQKCLEILDYRKDNFAPADQYSCYGGATQMWMYNSASGLVYNINSPLCLEVAYSSFADGADVGQYACHDQANQQWDFWIDGTIHNRLTHKCLEVYAFSTAEFARIDQWSCWGGQNQRWQDGF